MKSDQPKRYVVEKHVMATSVQEALKKEPKTPVRSVYPDPTQPCDTSLASAIGFHTVSAEPVYECAARQPKKKD